MQLAQTFYFSISKRKKKIINDQADAALNQCKDDDYDNDHNKKNAALESIDANRSNYNTFTKTMLKPFIFIV